MRNGILVGGNWIIDQVKVIDQYPPEERLVTILEEYQSNGGAAYNVLKDLFKMQVPFPMEGVGLVGRDEKGNQILEDCKNMAIDISQMRVTDRAFTSYTDVMSVASSGKRTFFHYRGTNSLLDESHFDFSESRARIFHLGYLLLLDQLDRVGKDGLTGASKILKNAKENRFCTSVDLVSETSERFKKIIPSSLPFIDYFFVNEYEAAKLGGVATTDENEKISIEGCYHAAQEIIKMGVQGWVIVHFPEGALAVNHLNEKIFQPGVRLSSDKIAGSVGAGDAFAAGVLTGIHQGWEMSKCLELGVCVAATSLFKATASDGVLPYKECLKIGKGNQ